MWHSKIVPHFAVVFKDEVAFLLLPDACTFSLHYKVPRVCIVEGIMFSL